MISYAYAIVLHMSLYIDGTVILTAIIRSKQSKRN